jgi:curved DNA-binding protein CbpA
MIETVLSSPDMVYEAKRAGVYGQVLFWISDCRQGRVTRFPYAPSVNRNTIQHEEPRWSMYSTPVQETQVVVSPVAKALDYFQESLALLGIDESDGITAERLKAGYRAASLRAHPDKGGSKEAFDEVTRAYKYVEKILLRINPKMTAAEKTRLTTPVTMENAIAGRAGLEDVAPVQLSAKKLDMSTFNKLFEENRLPDPGRDAGYGDWMASTGGSDEVSADPRLKGKFNQQTFEAVFRERAAAQTAGTAITKKLEPDALMPTTGTELGGDTRNFTAAFGADTQFVDLKEAYTTGSTRYHEVADVRVSAKSVRSVEEAKRLREAEMARVDPDEASRIAAAAAALEERERQRRLRLAQQDTAAESWADQMRRRMFVTNG